MSVLQQILTRVLPHRMAETMRSETEEWGDPLHWLRKGEEPVGGGRNPLGETLSGEFFCDSGSLSPVRLEWRGGGEGAYSGERRLTVPTRCRNGRAVGPSTR